MCVKLLPGDLKPRPLPPTPHKHLYLWSDHHTKGMRWYPYKFCVSFTYTGFLFAEEFFFNIFFIGATYIYIYIYINYSI